MITVDDFLQPISENDACGQYLAYDLVYDQIREHRREDDQTLPQGIWQTNLKKANWAEVIHICSDLLRTKTKDLQVAMWMLEALTVTEGFDGLANGLHLVRALCDKFWDDIHPTLGEDGSPSHRMAPFYFLGEKIPERIVLIPLIQPTDGISASHNLSDWLIARRNLKIKNTNGLSLKQLKKSVASTSLKFLETTESRIASLVVELKSLNDFLNEKNGADAPSFRELLNSLEDIGHITSQNIAAKKLQAASEAQKAAAENVIEQEEDEETAPKATGAPVEGLSIEKSYGTLAELADFLEKAQPQSPAATLLRITAAVGRKTFYELLEMNIKTGVSVEHMVSELHRALRDDPG